MTFNPEQAHAALLAECERVGWPHSYRSDLLHDQRGLYDLAGKGCVSEFGWILREMGTHLFPPLPGPALSIWTGADRPDLGTFCGQMRVMARAVLHCDGRDIKCYWYANGRLKAVTWEQLDRRLAELDAIVNERKEAVAS